MRKPPRRRLYPMPVESLFDSPAWIAAPVALRGIVMSLCEHFWRTDCAPLPRDPDALFAIARAHRPTWSRHKATALALFESVAPELEAYWRRRESKTDQLALAAWRGGARNAARSARTALEASAPPPLVTLARPLTEAAQGPPKPPQTAKSQPTAKRFAQRTR